jgi:POT family proton-dependent oligopeptide transporter
LVYLTPILGGWFADNVLGQRKTIYIGGLVMAVGQFLLAYSGFIADKAAASFSDHRMFIFNLGLGVLIIGNGFFKPNISTIVGDLYDNNDPRKDSAFNIFYMGINLGAILGPFLAGALGENVAWQWGYFVAGVGMIISVIWLNQRETTLENNGMPPKADKSRIKLNAGDWRDIVLYAIGLVVITFLVIWVWGMLPVSVTSFIVIAGFTVIVLALAYVIIRGIEGEKWVNKFTIAVGIVVIFHILRIFWSDMGSLTQNVVIYSVVGLLIIGLIMLMRSKSNEWSRMSVIVTLAIFNVAFWAGFEQAGGTLNLFAAENTNRMFFNWEIPATWFQNINPFAILVFAPIFSVMWLKLNDRKLNPRTPVKFALGLLLGAFAFWIMTQADHSADGGKLVSPMWLVMVYVVLTLGELMLSPIGLSMITKLAPPKLVSVVMGLWMASFAAGNYLAGVLEGILETFDLSLYPFISMVMLIAAILLLALSPLLNKAMKGIH